MFNFPSIVLDAAGVQYMIVGAGIVIILLACGVLFLVILAIIAIVKTIKRKAQQEENEIEDNNEKKTV